MKQQKRKKRIQTDLFFDLPMVGGPIPLEMPVDLKAELESLMAELLLNVVIENPEIHGGGDCDE